MNGLAELVEALNTLTWPAALVIFGASLAVGAIGCKLIDKLL